MAKAKKGKSSKPHQPALETVLPQTCQCRPELTEKAGAFLEDTAQLLGHLEHSLFTDMQRLGITVGQKQDQPAGAKSKGKKEAAKPEGKKEKRKPSQKPADVLKRRYLAENGITSRQYNAILARVTGEIRSIQERRPGLIEELEGRIETNQRQIQNIGKRVDAVNRPRVRQNGKFELHNRKRKLDNQKHRLQTLKDDAAANRIRLCFGSKKLFMAQFHLAKNGFATHADWKAAWRQARASQVYFIGAKCETAGNQTAQLHVSGDHELTLTLRVPDCLHEKHGKFLVISGIRIAYGFDAIVAALDECRMRSQLKRQKNDSYQEHGQAISVRFKRDAKGWLLLITTGLARPAIITSKKHGVFGVDLNADHLAVVETDAHGNPIGRWSIPWNCYGLSRTQAEALTSAVVVQLVELAGRAGKPIVIEKLNFQAKKQTLKGESKRYARMLSSFAYNRFYTMLTSRAFRLGVEVWAVNPAYTSVIGRVRFQDQYGLTVHQAAALVIGRRFLGCSERPPRRWRPVPDGRKGHVAFAAPARMRKPDGRPAKHIWTFWAAVSKQFKAAHEARRREDHGLAWLDRLRRRLQSGACGQGKRVSSGQRTRNRRSDPAGVTCA